MASVQSIIDRVTYITRDPARVRHTFEEILSLVQDAQLMIATLHPRASTRYTTLTLLQGARQDLRLIDPTGRWLRLFAVEYNVDADDLPGASVRQISRRALDNTMRNWRSATPQDTVEEFAVDEREPFTFDVNPPAVEGTKVMALVAVTPPAIETEESDFGLAEGYDIAAVDYVLYRLFSKDASDASYAARATAHLQAFGVAIAAQIKDASAE
jgi:hypothetical protein